MVGTDQLPRRILGKGNRREPMEVPRKGAVNHQKMDKVNLQEDHQKVDMMMKAIHRIMTMKTMVANCHQTRKRMWKYQTFLT